MLLFALLLAAQAPAPLIEVSFNDAGGKTGKIFAIDVSAPPSLPAIVSVAPSLNGKHGIGYAVSDDRRHWKVLVPVDIESKAGKKGFLPQPLIVDAAFADGRKTQWKKPVPIRDGIYDKRQLSVGKQFTSPSKKQKARAEKESKELSAAMATFSTERYWRGSFASPVTGGQTSPFGTLRTYNKLKRSRHMGLDLDGNTGDPIVAAGRGKVLLAAERFYSGGTVLLDHGQGFMTMYFHMSRIDVKAGALVEKGQGLGAVGASGQVTGPHLHFSVKLGGEYVDGAQLLGLDLSDDIEDRPPPSGP